MLKGVLLSFRSSTRSLVCILRPYSIMSGVGLSPGDPSSHSRPDQVRVTSLHLDLEVNFDKRVLDGFVTLGVEKLMPELTCLKLDTNQLDIHEVVDDNNKKLEWQQGDIGNCGAELSVHLSPTTRNVTIKYTTSPSSSALQWLTPQQTTSGEHPFLFSQCQAIHARSMIPCQDTPSIKVPYTANITAPSQLTILMSALTEETSSADNKNRPNMKTHSFSQPVPVQSYLIALAVGHLQSRVLGPRCKVWAETDQLADLASHDFSGTEKMLSTAESLCGRYLWEVYDILVLPPSFPFGGMENPCLTFATPTLLSGDQSNANVIAHEIAHSWTGNLVTNCNFEHFWLNEGWTVFLERKILGRLQGEPESQLSAIIGWRDLEETVGQELGPTNRFTALVPRLAGVDPDDAFSSVPYEKGFTFLTYLEHLVGGSVFFEKFMKSYIEKFAHKSIDSDMFKSYFLSYFADLSVIKEIDWEGWFYTPGMPPYTPTFDRSLVIECQQLADLWLTNEEPPKSVFEFDKFSATQKQEFLGLLLTASDPISSDKIELMDELYKLSSCPNVEILFLFIRVGLRARWPKSVDLGLDLATKQGRMKFVRPLFRDMAAWSEQRDRVVQVFTENKEKMMSVCQNMVSKDLGLEEVKK